MYSPVIVTKRLLVCRYVRYFEASLSEEGTPQAQPLTLQNIILSGMRPNQLAGMVISVVGRSKSGDIQQIAEISGA